MQAWINTYYRASKYIRASIGYPAEKIISPLIIGAFTRQNPLKVKKQLPPFAEWRIQSVTNPNKTLAGAKSFDNFYLYLDLFLKTL